MRFLIDEMFGSAVASQLREQGHDAVHVHELGLGGAADRDVLARAAEDDRVVITEDMGDFVPLLEERAAAGLPVPALVIALRRKLPSEAGAMEQALVEKLARWADKYPDPYRHAHWLG